MFRKLVWSTLAGFWERVGPVFSQDEEFSLEFVKSGAAIGV